MTAPVQGSGDDHHIGNQDPHANPTLKALQPVGWTASELDGALDNADAAFDAIAEVQSFAEPALLLIGHPLG